LFYYKTAENEEHKLACMPIALIAYSLCGKTSDFICPKWHYHVSIKAISKTFLIITTQKSHQQISLNLLFMKEIECIFINLIN